MSELGWKRRVRRWLSRTLRPAEAWLRQRLLLGTDRIAMRTRASPDTERVLLIRMDHIGDFVVWLDAACALVEHYRRQGKRVTLVANAVWKDWAAELGIFDEVMGIEERRFRQDLRYRLRMGRLVRQLRCGTAVQPAATRVLTLGDSLVRLSGAEVRVGPEGSFDNTAQRDRRVGDRWYTSLFPVDSDIRSEMRRNAAFVRALTNTGYKARVADLRGRLDLCLDDPFSAELAGRSYFVLFPGASHYGRLWPVERYQELANRISRQTGWLGVVCGGPGEAALALQLCGGAEAPLLNWVGQTSLTQLTAVLAGAELLVANDTSAVHIAAAVGVPSVCIVGGGHYDRFLPYEVEHGDERPLPIAAAHKMECFHCDWRCRYHPPKGTPFPCIDNVLMASAWEAVQRALASRLVVACPFVKGDLIHIEAQQRPGTPLFRVMACELPNDPRVLGTATL